MSISRSKEREKKSEWQSWTFAFQFIDAYVKAEITSKLRNFTIQLLCVDTIHSVFPHFFFVIFRHVVAFASQTHTQSSVTEKQSSVEKSAHTRKKPLQIISMYRSLFCVCARVRFFSFIFFSTFGLWIYLVFLFSAQCCYCAICVQLLLFEARRNHMFQQLSRALIQKTAATTARLTSIAYFSLNIWTEKK